MTLFLSTYINKVDAKGRVSVPAPFRDALYVDRFPGVVLLRSAAHPCLDGFGRDFMHEMADRLDRFDLFSQTQDDLAATLFGEAAQLPFDGEGRVMLPADLMAYAEIDGQAAFVGMGRKFQIWSPDNIAARQAQARENVRAQGLTLPSAKTGKGKDA